MPALKPPSPPKKGSVLPPIRVDEELHTEASQRAQQFGGLSAVVRALLKMFVAGELDEPLKAMTPEEKRRPSRKKAE
jgi:hypothetical protein